MDAELKQHLEGIETRMREHVVAPPGSRPPCAGIPEEIASDLSKQRVMDTRMAADVIRTHLRMRLTEGETMDQIQDWYHRPSTSQLLQGLAGAPSPSPRRTYPSA